MRTDMGDNVTLPDYVRSLEMGEARAQVSSGNEFLCRSDFAVIGRAPDRIYHRSQLRCYIEELTGPAYGSKPAQSKPARKRHRCRLPRLFFAVSFRLACGVKETSMRKVLRYLAWGMAAILIVIVGANLWAYQVAQNRYTTEWQVHKADFPIPFPLPAEGPAGAAAGGDALAVAIQRGKHLVQSRAGCNGCHGDDFGGAAVVDMPLIGHWMAPNLTLGEGSVVRDFTANDWDRAVRHAVRHNGQSSSMPAQEFVNLSDHELSDIVAYLGSLPPVNRDVGKVRFGPAFNFVVATDRDALAAFNIDHNRAHAVEPPAETAGAELGEHIALVCTGCHGTNFSGGKIVGDPNMPIVANLTPHETGLKSWNEDDFFHALRDGIRKDGSAINPAMPWRAYGNMSDTEIKALWSYLQTIPAVEKGER